MSSTWRCLSLLLLPLSLLPACGEPEPAPSPGTPLAARSAAASATSDLMDFLIQDVCPGNPSQDPLECADHRDLKPGEPMYYERFDQLRAQIHHSFPAWSDGEVVVNTFDFAPFDVWNPSEDGYDIIEASPPYVSIIDTRDPTGLGQTFVRTASNGGCEVNDTWIVFPTTGYRGTGSTVARLFKLDWELNGQARPGVCSGSDGSAYTTWTSATHTYSSGKVLDSIISHHYGGASVSQAGASEKFYFTRVYGLTRWEAWRKGGTPIPDANCNGPKFNGEWVMVDCRDWTRIEARQTGREPRRWPAPIPRFPTQTHEAEGTSLFHGTGRAEGDGWSAATAWDAPGYLAYGPYTRLPAGPKEAWFDLLVDNTTADNQRVVHLDVYDATAGAIRASRAVTRQQLAAPWVYQGFTLPFDATGDNSHELRVWWDRTSYVRLDRIRVGEARSAWVLPMSPLVFEAEGPQMAHTVGRADADGWSAATGRDAQGHMLYGPYTNQVLGGGRSATFRLMVDNTTADNLGVVLLDVHDATSGVSRASRVVTRQEFAAPWTYQDFTLGFNATGGHRYELRVWWYGVSYVRADRVTVR